MDPITYTLSPEKLASPTGAAQSADWFAKWLIGQLPSEALNNLQLFADVFSQTVRERLAAARVLASQVERERDSKAQEDLRKQIKALGLNNLPKVESPSVVKGSPVKSLSDFAELDF